MIDVNDCDARLPSSGSPHDLYVDELARLSIILGRVLKTVYRYDLSYLASERRLSDEFSPAGLMNTTDEVLAALSADIESWKKNLPPSLQFRGPDTPINAGSYHYILRGVLPEHWLCRSTLPVIHLRLDDFLARLHADFVLVPGTSQVCPHH